MPETREQSLIRLAEGVLAEKKQPMDLYELFDTVLDKGDVRVEDATSLLQTFYTDLTSSAKFTYMGQNTWDLKQHQKVELWEKDGSYYDEYKDVENPVYDERIAAAEEAERVHLEMLEKRAAEAEEERMKAAAEAEAEAQALAEAEAASEEAAESVEAVEEKSEPAAPEVEDTPPEETKEKVEIELVEDETEKEEEEDVEVDEEYEDFDEDKYHEYMDTYEDEYDK